MEDLQKYRWTCGRASQELCALYAMIRFFCRKYMMSMSIFQTTVLGARMWIQTAIFMAKEQALLSMPALWAASERRIFSNVFETSPREPIDKHSFTSHLLGSWA